MTLVFKPENHEYSIKGAVMPSVTQALEAAGLSDFSHVPSDVLERASLFGKAVHDAVQFDSKGTLDEENLDKAIRPYLQGWRNFVEDYGYTCIETEFRDYSPVYRFGFQIDQMGMITLGKFPGLSLADIKTGKPMPSHKYQMGGYKIAAGKQYKNIILVYLDPEYKPRGYKVVFVTNNKREQGVFLAALTLYNVKKEEGLI